MPESRGERPERGYMIGCLDNCFTFTRIDDESMQQSRADLFQVQVQKQELKTELHTERSTGDGGLDFHLPARIDG